MLDQMDLMLIRELEIDARQSYPDLAVKLGTSPTTVRRRLQGLLDKKIIRFAVYTDRLALGYGIQSIIGIKAHPGKVDAVVEELASFRNAHHILITTGRFDIVAWAIFRDYEDLLNFTAERLGKISAVADSEILLYLKEVKSSWTFLATEEGAVNQRATGRKLDPRELLLIRELELDPRQSLTKLAQKLDVSISGVRRKLQMLRDEGFVKMIIIPDHRLLGITIQAIVLIKVHPGKIYTVTAELTRYKQMQHVYITTGHYDIIAWAVFRDSADMYKVIGSEVGSIEGVIRHETVFIMKAAKSSFLISSTGDDDGQKTG